MNDQMQAAEDAINAKILALSGEQQGEEAVLAQPQDVVEPKADVMDLSVPEDHNPYAVSDDVLDVAQEQPAGEEDFEHKYRVLQGMYRKEVADVREENRRLSVSLSEATATIVQLRGRIEALQQRPAAPDPAVFDEKGLEAYAEFGPEILDLAKSNMEMRAELGQLRAQIPQIQNSVKQSAESEFTRYMDTNVPNWQEQNEDQGFIQWLASLCPGTGLTWHTSLHDAYEARDAARVAAIFKEYRKHLYLTSPAHQAEPARLQPAGRRLPAPAPASRGGGLPPASSAPQYTLKDWVNLQNEAARGLWNDRPAEYQAKEAAIHAALFPK